MVPVLEKNSPDGLTDRRRLAAVRRTGLLDTAPEEEFDRLTRLAALAIHAPLAFVTIIDDRRSFWKSCIGLEAPDLKDRQLPVEQSLCAYGVSTGRSLVVADTRADERTRSATPVTAMGVQAWASVPVHAPTGEVVGSFCVGDMRVRGWTRDEIAVLESLAAAAASEIALRDAAAQAITLARTLQEGLLPPVLPQLPGFEVATAYRAAEDDVKLVGDFFDVFESARGCWHVVVGDVAGHGLEAAMMAATARYAVRAAAVGSCGPGEILAHVNETLLAGPTDRRFLTMALVNVIGDGRLTVAVAGHPPPVLCRTSAPAALVPSSGPLLGAFPFEKERVIDVDVSMSAGDTLMMYTDGVTECGPRAEPLGEDGLLAILDQVRGASPEHIAAHVQRTVAARANEQPADDAAILVLRRR